MHDRCACVEIKPTKKMKVEEEEDENQMQTYKLNCVL